MLPALPVLMASSTALTAGVVAVVLGLVGPLPDADVAHGWRLASLLVAVLAGGATALLAGDGHPMLAMVLAGAAMVGAGAYVGLLRIAWRRRRGGEDGGGPGGGPGDGPRDPHGPGGVAVDWGRFEESFWSYVERHRQPVGR